jgi:dethiobiotin synthetase
MSSARKYFITSSGTEIGKTLVTSTLAYQLRQKGKVVNVQKPIITGWDKYYVMESDTGQLLQSIDEPLTQEAIDRTSPWRFKAPLSPHMASSLEGQCMDVDKVIAFSQRAEKKLSATEYLLVEGIGGAMVPLTYQYHSLQWMQALSYPVIVVVGSYLGAISHALTTVTALEHYHIPIAAIIITSKTSDEAILQEATCATLKEFTPYKVLILPYLGDSEQKNKWLLVNQKLPHFSDFIL